MVLWIYIMESRPKRRERVAFVVLVRGIIRSSSLREDAELINQALELRVREGAKAVRVIVYIVYPAELWTSRL